MRTVAFFSYTRVDDRASRGVLTAIREELEDLIQAEFGADVELFQDVDDIATGEEWRRRLAAALDEADYLVAVLSPSFFGSGPCRDELARFIAKAADEDRPDRVLPVLWRQTPDLSDPTARSADPLLRFIERRQWVDWTAHNYKTAIDDDLRRALNALAGELAQKLRADARSAPPPRHAGDLDLAPPDQAELAAAVDQLVGRGTAAASRAHPKPQTRTRAAVAGAGTFALWAALAAAAAIAAAAVLLRPPPAPTGSDAGAGARSAAAEPEQEVSTGDEFQDCAACPVMVEIPGGAFVMGSPEDEPGRYDHEVPQRRVSVQPFALGKYEVTFAEWDACVAAGGCGHRPDDAGWGRGNRPVINVSWGDVQQYVRWLNGEVGSDVYRLPSEAEWEYAARAGTDTPFWWGREITPDQANYDGEAAYTGGGETGVFRSRTVPVDSFAANPFGLYQVHGNVWEWVQDCWNEIYRGAPSNSSAWMSGDCSIAVLRGGSWDYDPRHLRSAGRGGHLRNVRHISIGFRVARVSRTLR